MSAALRAFATLTPPVPAGLPPAVTAHIVIAGRHYADYRLALPVPLGAEIAWLVPSGGWIVARVELTAGLPRLHLARALDFQHLHHALNAHGVEAITPQGGNAHG